MAQCVHLDRSGRRCLQEAAEDSSFCALHAAERAAEIEERAPETQKWVVRLAALLLLALFLLPLAVEGYRMLRALLR